MGSLILCHDKRAQEPYEITRIHRRIYTIEELCYYLCNNLYLVDYTIMNEKLCRWIETELGLTELADNLLRLLEDQGSIEQFVIYVLEYSKIYSESELNHIHNILEKLKNQSDVERQKFKADNLLSSGELEAAILVYQSILREWEEDAGDDKFYARICGCLGTAYGRAMLYEEAAKMYEKGHEITRDPTMLNGYLYACYCYMTKKGYRALLTRSEALMAADVSLEVQRKKLEKEIHYHYQPEDIDEWKKMYRKI